MSDPGIHMRRKLGLAALETNTDSNEPSFTIVRRIERIWMFCVLPCPSLPPKRGIMESDVMMRLNQKVDESLTVNRDMMVNT
jgi:hypothetical protein